MMYDVSTPLFQIFRLVESDAVEIENGKVSSTVQSDGCVWHSHYLNTRIPYSLNQMRNGYKGPLSDTWRNTGQGCGGTSAIGP